MTCQNQTRPHEHWDEQRNAHERRYPTWLTQPARRRWDNIRGKKSFSSRSFTSLFSTRYVNMSIWLKSASRYPATVPSFLRDLMPPITSPVFDIVILFEGRFMDDKWVFRHRLFHLVVHIRGGAVPAGDLFGGSGRTSGYTAERLKVRKRGGGQGRVGLPRPPVIISNARRRIFLGDG